MDIFKLKPGMSHIYPVSPENYEAATGQARKYRKESRTGESYFAVCPACDNPIQLIGLYKNTAESGRKPYGKHTCQTIPNLAEYDQDAYLDCPYSDPRRTPPTARRKAESRLSRQIIQLLHDQFDRVIHILSKETGICFSTALSKKMLEGYIVREGWSFRNAAPYNLPWAFVEGQVALPLYGQRICADCALHDAIAYNYPAARFEETPAYNSVRILQNAGQYVDLSFAFVSHKRSVRDEHLFETIDFWVYRGIAPKMETVYRNTLNIQTDYFLNLINLPDERSHRNQKLLDIADELLKTRL
ncbi:hypothetical protein [Oscillibacter sp.]|uniref:hypothetical protein n=1 Tax=Oscillibacter sp. TaxID=1945593 RepID=UPI003392A888